jgi:hypothetical protein
MFHVYALLNPLKPGSYQYDEYTFDFEPFYIGKGKNKRLYDHVFKAKNTKQQTFRLNLIRKILSSGNYPLSLTLRTDLSESDAFQIEKYVIGVIGRRDKGFGPLTNLSDGGEGDAGWSSNRKGKTYSEIYGNEKASIIKEKLSATQRKRITSKDTKEKISKLRTGKKLSDQTKAKISSSNKGRKITWGDKISASLKLLPIKIDKIEHLRKLGSQRNGVKLSESTRALMSASRKGKTMSDSTRAKLRFANVGKTMSLEQKQKMSEQRKGKSYEEYYGKDTAKRMKARMSQSRMKKFEIIDPDGVVFVTNDLQSICDKHNLSISCMYRVASGGRNHHHNWICRRVT